MTSGQYVVDDTACLNGTICSLNLNFNGPMAAPAVAYCVNGTKPSTYWKTVMFGPDSETRYPGDLCIVNVTNCYGKGTC